MTIVDILRRAKVDVVVASVEKSVQILASQGTKIIADKLIGVAAELTYDLIILPVRQTKSLVISYIWLCPLISVVQNQNKMPKLHN